MPSPQRVCPNPSCPYAQKHGAAARFRAGARTCNDCGTALVDDVAAVVAPAATSRGDADRSGNGLALVVTAAAAATAPLLMRIPLPFVDVDAVARMPGTSGADLRSLSVGAAGLAPWLTAAVVVEIVAALVPSLRPMRHDARRLHLLRASYALGLVLAAVQAITAVRWMQSIDVGHGAIIALDLSTTALVVATMTAGACVAPLAAELVRRFGVGNGWVAVIAGGTVGHGVAWLRSIAASVQSEELEPMAALVALTCVAVPLFVTWRFVRPFDNLAHPDPDVAPRPSAGLVALPIAFATPGIVASLASFSSSLPALSRGDLALLSAAGAVAVAAFALCAVVFTHEQAGDRSRAMPASVVLNAAVFGSWALVQRSSFPALDVVGVAFIAAAAKDLALELRARSTSGPLASIAMHARFASAATQLRALNDGGIRAVPRAAHYRALLHFFAPLAPIEVLVPLDDVERAREVIGK